MRKAPTKRASRLRARRLLANRRHASSAPALGPARHRNHPRCRGRFAASQASADAASWATAGTITSIRNRWPGIASTSCALLMSTTATLIQRPPFVVVGGCAHRDHLDGGTGGLRCGATRSLPPPPPTQRRFPWTAPPLPDGSGRPPARRSSPRWRRSSPAETVPPRRDRRRESATPPTPSFRNGQLSFPRRELAATPGGRSGAKRSFR